MATAIELLSALQFQEELQRVAHHSRPRPAGESPLAATVKRIEENPAYSQSRLLTRILTALTYRQGEFRRAEIAAFDSETLAMVVALMDAYASGTPAREEWVRAVDAAQAAQSGCGG